MSNYIEPAEIFFLDLFKSHLQLLFFPGYNIKIAEIFFSEKAVYIILTKTFMTLVLDGIWKNTYFTEKCFV